MHREGVAATADGRPAEGARLLRAGLALLGWNEQDTAGQPSGTEHDALVARLLISLAYAEAEQGRTRYGFELLDRAMPLTDLDYRGVLLQQRALMLYRVGQFDDALKYFDAAVPQLTEPQHAAVLCRTLLNRAALYYRTGRITASRDDLAQCGMLAQQHGLELLAAKALHGRGVCDQLVGDLPTALAAFDAAEPLYRAHGPGFLPVLTAARAGALLTAGLASEAGRNLDEAIEAFRRQRLTQEQAEAELLRSWAALGSGEHDAAASWARRAERRFRRRGNHAWAELAALMRLRADLPDTRSPVALAGRATRLAGRLRDVGLSSDAEMADLLSVRALVAAGRAGPAQRRMSAIPRSRSTVSPELLLTRRMARAELARAQGRPRQAFAQIRQGLSILHGWRSRVGSLELQVGIAALGRDLATAGLDMAFDRGPPAEIFAWSERSRAQAFRVPPVHPPADPDIAEALAELRQLRDMMRSAELERRREPGAWARCAELERVIQERSWRLAGPGHSAPEAGLAEIAAELSASGHLMVSFLARHGRLHALLVHEGTVRLVALGDHGVVEEAATRLLTDLDALAGRSLPAPLEAVIRGSVQRQLDILTDEVIAVMRAELADHDLVIVPTMALSSLPWGLLPDLRGRSVTVSASASAWLSARRSKPPAADRPRSNSAPLLVAGPDLAYAETEIAEIAKVRPGSRLLSGARATVAATLHGLDGAPVAHLAAHGHHERENVLFSRLDLADGPLMAYDIQQLAAAPRQVTLSACDVGRTEVRAGDEILGFTAALLYAGTSSVVSSVARVTHHAAAAVMTGYYRAVAGGAEPARALAAASLADPLAPFVCFGAG